MTTTKAGSARTGTRKTAQQDEHPMLRTVAAVLGKLGIPFDVITSNGDRGWCLVYPSAEHARLMAKDMCVGEKQQAMRSSGHDEGYLEISGSLADELISGDLDRAMTSCVATPEDVVSIVSDDWREMEHHYRMRLWRLGRYIGYDTPVSLRRVSVFARDWRGEAEQIASNWQTIGEMRDAYDTTEDPLEYRQVRSMLNAAVLIIEVKDSRLEVTIASEVDYAQKVTPRRADKE